MIELSTSERRALRARAHPLRPVVTIGKDGLTPAVVHEIDLALSAHELIKIRVHNEDRDARDAFLARVCEELAAAPVQHLGKLLIVYRARPKAKTSDKPVRATKRTKARGKTTARRPSPPLAGRKVVDSAHAPATSSKRAAPRTAVSRARVKARSDESTSHAPTAFAPDAPRRRRRGAVAASTPPAAARDASTVRRRRRTP